MRALAVLGALMLAGFTASQATAAPADRAGDAVVLKGDKTGMIGTMPGEIVGFKWDDGWVQVPVQVDERHTINVRQLYPDDTGTNPYIGDVELGFEVEVYADPKTRSGADSDPTFDVDDELTFMAGDTGTVAPADGDTPPAGTDDSIRTKVDVSDPVGGGDDGVLYLFQSSSLDPSAGKDYVDYDFKLNNLTGGQTLLDDYGYIHSSNPEDSTVTTDKYELHSFDRWQEDELKVKAGNSTGADILDREVAQATKDGCSRSEYTFSGRWTEDSKSGNDGNTDDEGTYVNVIDGPVRAIRTYMGANSGPYVQREHIYYADHEVNTIYLRVHVMTDLYAWTDYAPSAIGMTYRDMNNLAGVPIDGVPDTVTPTTTSEVANGAYAWQQVSGAQGTLSTVVGSTTDIPNPTFGNYYLDDSTPTAGNEVQCGGDGQSIGSSGFGILGPITPNTDPRLATDSFPVNHLTVDRVRYFGPPSDGVEQAENYRARVEKPLTGVAGADPIAGKAKFKLKLPKKTLMVKASKKAKFKVRFKNVGGTKSAKAKICLKGPGSKSCKRGSKLAPGKAMKRKVSFKVKRRFRKGKRIKVRIAVKAKGARTARGVVRIRVK
ncbi:MAG: hypothetical protein IPK93_06735 [Solirubrobacterales bacterium]|nr:hypothetical protein [Solirubrobacterales bacterium]